MKQNYSTTCFSDQFLPQPPPEGDIASQPQVVPLWRGLGEEKKTEALLFFN